MTQDPAGNERIKEIKRLYSEHSMERFDMGEPIDKNCAWCVVGEVVQEVIRLEEEMAERLKVSNDCLDVELSKNKALKEENGRLKAEIATDDEIHNAKDMEKIEALEQRVRELEETLSEQTHLEGLIDGLKAQLSEARAEVEREKNNKIYQHHKCQGLEAQLAAKELELAQAMAMLKRVNEADLQDQYQADFIAKDVFKFLSAKEKA